MQTFNFEWYSGPVRSQSGFRLTITALVATLLTAPAGAQDVGSAQSPQQFAAAVDNESNSPSYVLLTIVDGRSGEAKTGCTLAVFLLGAMHTERGLDYSPSSIQTVRDLVLAQTDHRYVLSNPEALHNLRFESLEWSEPEACRIIRSGHPAYQQHRSLSIIEGQPE